MARRYETPEAFKQALEARVRRAARENAVDMGRFRQLLVFDRFLAHVFEEFADRVIVKGGVVLHRRRTGADPRLSTRGAHR